MSRHFELMQRLEQERDHSTSVVDEPYPLPIHEIEKGHPIDRRLASDEALRLVQQLFLLQAGEPPSVVVFAGIDHGSGCTGICASVAAMLAKSTRKQVCLVEANFRSPSLAEFFGTDKQRGLTDSILQDGPIRSFAEPVVSDNLWLMSSGSIAVDSPSLLTSERLRDRLAEIRDEFHFVIIDAAPLTRYSDAIAISGHASGLVLVVEAGASRREAAAAAVENLRMVNIPILAAVLNKRTFPIPENIYRRL
jgi:Mrp family chromosome partitioning ATPase